MLFVLESLERREGLQEGGAGPGGEGGDGFPISIPSLVRAAARLFGGLPVYPARGKGQRRAPMGAFSDGGISPVGDSPWRGPLAG